MENVPDRPFFVVLDPSDGVFYGIMREALEAEGVCLGSSVSGEGVFMTPFPETDVPQGLEKLCIPVPFRVGAVLKEIRKVREETDLTRPVQMGPYTLRPSDGFLVWTEGAPIRLTDRERDLILALARAVGRRLGRKELLEKVWFYVKGVETHTVETLVYRLRQKIEPDPANPVFLLTDGQGYRLAE